MKTKKEQKYYKIKLTNKYLDKNISSIKTCRENVFLSTPIYATKIGDSHFREVITNQIFKKYNNEDDLKTYVKDEIEVEKQEVKMRIKQLEEKRQKTKYISQLAKISDDISKKYFEYKQEEKIIKTKKDYILDVICKELNTNAKDLIEKQIICEIDITNSAYSLNDLALPVLGIKIDDETVIELFSQRIIKKLDKQKNEHLTFVSEKELNLDDAYNKIKLINNYKSDYLNNLDIIEEKSREEYQRRINQEETDKFFNEIMNTKKQKTKSFLKTIVDNLK